MMTKKDFQVIANALSQLSITCRAEVFGKLKDPLKEINPRFDALKFYEALFPMKEKGK